ncbi:MAG: hypothetical protein R2731_01980 [Nocardioides sp.]
MFAPIRQNFAPIRQNPGRRRAPRSPQGAVRRHRARRPGSCSPPWWELAGLPAGSALGWDWSLLYVLPFVPLAIALAVVDWRTMLLPIRLGSTPATCWCWPRSWSAGWCTATPTTSSAGWGWPGRRRPVRGAVVRLTPRPRYGDVRLAGVLGLGLAYLGWGPS